MAKYKNLTAEQIQQLAQARPDVLAYYQDKKNRKGESITNAVTDWWFKIGIKEEGSWEQMMTKTQSTPTPEPGTIIDEQGSISDQTIDQVPEFLRNDPNFQALPDDLKQIAIYTYNIQKQNDETKAKALSDAYDQAVEQADPYWKNIIRIAQDELLNSFSAQKGDYQAIQDRLNQRISELNTDLQSGTEFLNLEQQQELANLTLSYTKTRDTLIESSAQQGLTFSTKRKLAEQQLGQYNQGMVESTKRQYQKQISDLEREVASGNLTAQKDLEEAKRKYNEGILATGRTAESYLGTEGLPALEGYQPLGTTEAPVTGQIYEEKTADVAQRQQTLYNELTQSSLNY